MYAQRIMDGCPDFRLCYVLAEADNFPIFQASGSRFRLLFVFPLPARLIFQDILSRSVNPTTSFPVRLNGTPSSFATWPNS